MPLCSLAFSYLLPIWNGVSPKTVANKGLFRATRFCRACWNRCSCYRLGDLLKTVANKGVLALPQKPLQTKDFWGRAKNRCAATTFWATAKNRWKQKGFDSEKPLQTKGFWGATPEGGQFVPFVRFTLRG